MRKLTSGICGWGLVIPLLATGCVPQSEVASVPVQVAGTVIPVPTKFSSKAKSVNSGWTRIEDGKVISLPVGVTSTERQYVDELTQWLMDFNEVSGEFGQHLTAQELKRFHAVWLKVKRQRDSWKQAPERYKIADDWLMQGLKEANESFRLYRQGQNKQADLKLDSAREDFSTSSESLNIALRP